MNNQLINYETEEITVTNLETQFSILAQAADVYTGRGKNNSGIVGTIGQVAKDIKNARVRYANRKMAYYSELKVQAEVAGMNFQEAGRVKETAIALREAKKYETVMNVIRDVVMDFTLDHADTCDVYETAKNAEKIAKDMIK